MIEPVAQSGNRAQPMGEAQDCGGTLSFKSSLLAAKEAQAGSRVEEALTLEEYKEKIYDEIARILQGSSRRVRTQVYISEAGFARMQADSAYEQKVMELLRRDIGSVFLPGGGTQYLTIQVGKELDEYRASSFTEPERKVEKKEESYWDNRAKRRRERLEWEKERQEKRIAQKIFFTRLRNLRAKRKDGEDMPIINTISAAELFSGV